MEYLGEYGKTAKPKMAAKPRKFYYLEAQARQRVEEIVQLLSARGSKLKGWEALCEALPLERGLPQSLSRRVEGLDLAAEKLWALAVEGGRKAFGPGFDRESLRRAAGILPISHYHYLSGSREPHELVQTRRDALNDPTTALVKLRRDIEALTEFIQHLP